MFRYARAKADVVCGGKGWRNKHSVGLSPTAIRRFGEWYLNAVAYKNRTPRSFYPLTTERAFKGVAKALSKTAKIIMIAA